MQFFMDLLLAIFDRIFMNISLKCRNKILAMICTILGRFCYFGIGKGPIFGPKSDLGKSLYSVGCSVEIWAPVGIFG